MDKLTELYELSNQIITTYGQLISLYNYDKNNTLYKSLITDIKDLIFNEYKLIHSISLEEINNYLEEINSIDIEERNKPWLRIRDKLIDYKDFLLGNFIISKDLEISNIPNNLPLCIYDVIISMISIGGLYGLLEVCKFTNAYMRVFAGALFT